MNTTQVTNPERTSANKAPQRLAEEVPALVPVLSVCIATMKREAQITQQVTKLLSISEGLPVEIVVADASPEGSQLAVTHPRMTVLSLEAPNGIDADYDCAVSAARGAYCWLLTDDDEVDDDVLHRLLPMLYRIDRAPSLVLIDARVFDPAGNLLQESKLPLGFPTLLEPNALPAEFGGAAGLLSYIGSVVISRSEWLHRRSEKYVGTEFRHVGLILEAPFTGSVVFLTPPAITIQYGVAHWEPRAVRVWTAQWPAVIRDSVKSPGDWRSFYSSTFPRQIAALLGFRARSLVSQSDAHSVYPEEKSKLKRFCFSLATRFPPSLAACVVLNAAKITRTDDRLLRFDIHRARRATQI